MHTWIKLGLVAAATAIAAPVAEATPEGEVESAVKVTIDHLADAGSTGALTKGATVIGIHANIFDVDSGKILDGEHTEDPIDFKTHGKLWPMIFGTEAPAGTRTLGKTTVVVDPAAHTAWFAAPLTAGKQTMHVSGLALADGSGKWALRVLSIELAVPDSELAKNPVLAPEPARVPATPTSALGKAVVSWFGTHALAKAAAAAPIAGGSAPAEISAGPAAVKFAASLDHLQLIPIAVTADDTTGIAWGTALMPISKREQDGQVEFGFTVYAVREGATWHWKSIQFAGDQVPEFK